MLVRAGRKGEVGIKASRDEAPPNAETLLFIVVDWGPPPPFRRPLIMEDDSGCGARVAFLEEEDVVVGVVEEVGCCCVEVVEGFDKSALVRLSHSSEAPEVAGTRPRCRHDNVELPSTPIGVVMVVVDLLLGAVVLFAMDEDEVWGRIRPPMSNKSDSIAVNNNWH